MPLYGGQTIQGNKVRLTGLAMLTLSVISLFISSKIGLLLIFLAIIPMAVLYLFGKAEEELGKDSIQQYSRNPRRIASNGMDIAS